MKLITKPQCLELIKNGRRQTGVRGTAHEIDFRPVVKLFNPSGSATWLLTEIDPGNLKIGWGLYDLGIGSPRFGQIDIRQLEASRSRFGFGIERDLYFLATTSISHYIAEAKRLGYINA